MNDTELTQLLEYVFGETNIDPKTRFMIWRDQFIHIDKQLAFEAARMLKRKKTFGNPECSDLWACIDKLKRKDLPLSLKCLPAEALDALPTTNMFYKAAHAHGVSNMPDVGQCESPEDLAKQTKIADAIYKKYFKEKIDQLQQRSIAEIDAGKEPLQAIILTIEQCTRLKIPDKAYEKANLPVPKAVNLKQLT